MAGQRLRIGQTARQLGIHRHTLRNRIDTAGVILGLNLDGLRDKLELFAALQFLDLAEPLGLIGSQEPTCAPGLDRSGVFLPVSA